MTKPGSRSTRSAGSRPGPPTTTGRSSGPAAPPPPGRTTATGDNSIIGVAEDLLRAAARAAKPARLAAETQALGDCRYCTFHGATEGELERTLAAVDAAAQAYPSFAGIAVHRYDTWIALGD
ncbi:hypothetical protein ACFFX1_01450 [Dactylosporangium sucinum]|uniref:Uncharacterized protein n=1 Tax=Dactylosporangium sucinum TaxID=1424081 RepID=A0A917T3D7_9ACTN|nr:hypothetical protein [Dactylosporangium sucinum]GGM09186.1 hypothetical protein GCM10007977_007890 [Dactylosporangium sucinum]